MTLSPMDKLRGYDWTVIAVFVFGGIFACALIGIPVYQHVVPKAVGLYDCKFELVSGTSEAVVDVWSMEKVGILDQEYVVRTTGGERRFRASSVATWEYVSNGRRALIKRSCRRGGDFAPVDAR